MPIAESTSGGTLHPSQVVFFLILSLAVLVYVGREIRRASRFSLVRLALFIAACAVAVAPLGYFAQRGSYRENTLFGMLAMSVGLSSMWSMNAAWILLLLCGQRNGGGLTRAVRRYLRIPQRVTTDVNA
jgi:hypothetical protein